MILMIHPKFSKIKYTRKDMNSKKLNCISDFNWIVWQNNSCRYDSFLTIFITGLYQKFNDFRREKADMPPLLFTLPLSM